MSGDKGSRVTIVPTTEKEKAAYRRYKEAAAEAEQAKKIPGFGLLGEVGIRQRRADAALQELVEAMGDSGHPTSYKDHGRDLLERALGNSKTMDAHLSRDGNSLVYRERE